MDETSGEPVDEANVIARSRSYELVETSDGYAIWRAGDPSGAPLAVFPGDDAGYAAADRDFRRRNRQVRTYVILPKVLAAVVFVFAPLWVVLKMTADGWDLFVVLDGGSLGSGAAYRDVRFAEGVAYAVWLGSLAILLALFLLRSVDPGAPEGR
jgi:hypothetical protein